MNGTPVQTPALSPEERLYRAFEEEVDAGSFDGNRQCNCLIGQLCYAFSAPYPGSMSTLAREFGVEWEVVFDIYKRAADYGIDYEGAMAMARDVLGVTR